MLGGSIDVRSQLGKGTEVKVTLPMMRGVQGPETPVSTPNSTSTLDRQQDDSMAVLRGNARDTRVALYGFNTNEVTGDDKSLKQYIEKSLATYITEWYDLALTNSSQGTSSADIVIIDEEHLSTLLTSQPKAPGELRGPAIVCLCSNATRYGKSSACAVNRGIIEFVSKPFGPYKLAKALRLCLGRIHGAENEAQTTKVVDEPEEIFSTTAVEDVIQGFEKVAIEPEDETTPMNFMDNGVVQANEASTNAQMAIDAGTVDGKERRVDFPFPDTKGPSRGGDLVRRESRSDSISRRRTDPAVPQASTSHTTTITKRDEISSTADPPSGRKNSEMESKQEKRAPRILLVDDNKINLRLLQTYMRKRQYNLVDSADNGSEAVQAAQQSEGYDIIFMGQ